MPPALFALVILERRVSLFAQATMDHNPPMLDCPPLLGQYVPPHSAFYSWDGVWLTVCLGWPGIVIPQISAFCIAWDDKHTPSGPAIGWDGTLLTFCLGLALNHDPPIPGLPSGWDDGLKPPVSGSDLELWILLPQLPKCWECMWAPPYSSRNILNFYF
jgi:hypothetical protein